MTKHSSTLGVVVDHGLNTTPVVDHEAANLRDNASGVLASPAPVNDGGKPLQDSAWAHDCPKSTGSVLLPVWSNCRNCGARAPGVKGPDHG